MPKLKDLGKAGIKKVPAAVGYYFGGPTGAIAADTLVNGMSGSKGKPSYGQNAGGWNAMPPQFQQAYLNSYLPGVMSYHNRAETPQQLGARQSMAGDIDTIRRELPQYMALYDESVLEPTIKKMREDAEYDRNRIRGSYANSGLGGLFSSSKAIELSKLDQNTNDRIAALRASSKDAHQKEALGLRRQTLADMINGSDPQYDQLRKLGGLLGVLPQGSYGSNVGPINPYQNNALPMFMEAFMNPNGQYNGWGGFNPSPNGGWQSYLPFDFANTITGGRPWKLG